MQNRGLPGGKARVFQFRLFRMFRSCSNLHRLSRLCSVLNKQQPSQTILVKCTQIESPCIPAQIRYKEYSVVVKNVASANPPALSGESIDDHEIKTAPGASLNADQTIEVENSTAAAGVDDQDRKLKILKLEVSVLRQEGRKVPDPDLMKPAHWDHLMQLTSKSARTKYYTFLWSIERKKESTQVGL